MLFPDRLIKFALGTAERAQDMSTRATIERQHIAFAHMVAHGVLGIDSMEANAYIPVSRIKRDTFAGLVGELVHERQKDISETQAALIDRAEHQRLRTDLIVAIIKMSQVAIPKQRLRDPQNRALVKPRALRQLSESESLIRWFKCGEY